MKYTERDEIINQIVMGKYFIYSDKSKLFIYQEPSPQLIWKAQLESKKYEKKLTKLPLVERSFLTEEEAKEYLLKEGIWSDHNENKLKDLQNNLDTLEKNKKQFKYQSSKLEVVQKAIDVTNKEIKELTSMKYQIAGQTIAFQAKVFFHQYIISYSLLEGDSEEQVWGNFEEFENANHQLDIEALVNKIFYVGIFSITQLREVARSEPWRGLWKMSCKMGVNVFATPYLTPTQKSLGYWSAVYDNVYEHPYSPLQNVIDDDDLLDAWFEEQHKKSLEDKAKSDRDTKFSNNKKINQASEVFVKADNAVDAQKVYKELNTEDGLRKIRQRQLFLEKKETVNETELPDVAANLRLEQNKMAIQKMKKK